jgi:hypothetical protein
VLVVLGVYKYRMGLRIQQEDYAANGMEAGMDFTGRLWAGGTRALIGGLCLTVLCGASGRLAAQTGAQQATAQLASAQQGIQMASAKADALALPDAPVPVAVAESALDSGETLSSSSSLLTYAQNQPPSNGPSLGDLGLSPADTEGNAARQAVMDRRTHMLKVHQRLGLITVIPVAAACISAAGATPDKGNYSDTTSRDIHVALGATAVLMYAATASYAIRAPRVSHEPARGGVKWHKYLIYIHAPGMVLTPILGAMAYNQIASGQKVHGIASAHAGVAAATAASYGAAILAVSWPIHLKF